MRAATAVETARTGISSTSLVNAARHWLSRFPLSVIQLAGRIGVGTVFFKAGLLKYSSWEFDGPLVPRPIQSAAARSCRGCPYRDGPGVDHAHLAVPGPRHASGALPLLGMILVIQLFVYPNVYSDHLVWGSILVLLLTRGPARSHWTIRSNASFSHVGDTSACVEGRRRRDSLSERHGPSWICRPQRAPPAVPASGSGQTVIIAPLALQARKALVTDLKLGFGLAISPDGRTLYASVSREQGDLWMIDLKGGR